MTDIKTFSTADYNIECVMVSSDPWFRGRDVAASLGYKDRDQAIRDHADDDKLRYHELASSASGPVKTKGPDALDPNFKTPSFINESGLYSLILKSQRADSGQSTMLLS